MSDSIYDRPLVGQSKSEVTQPNTESSKKEADIYTRPLVGQLSTKKETTKESPIDEGLALGAAAVGYGVNKLIPTEAIPPKGLDTARINLELAKDVAGRAGESVAQARAAQLAELDRLRGSTTAAKTELEALDDAYAAARARAAQLNALPTAPADMSAGDKWSQKVVGGMGPGGGSVTEAASNYRIQQGLSPDEAAKFATSRSGLIVPKTVDTTQPAFLNEAQREAQQKFLEAEARRKLGQGAYTTAQRNLDIQAKRPEVPSNLVTAQMRADERVAQAAKKLEELEKLKPNWASRVGAKLAKPILGALGAGMSVLEANEMIEQFEKGNYGEAAMSGMGMLGGALMAAPHPYAKVAGAALSLPPLVYGGYQMLKSDTPAQNKATGGVVHMASGGGAEKRDPSKHTPSLNFAIEGSKYRYADLHRYRPSYLSGMSPEEGRQFTKELEEINRQNRENRYPRVMADAMAEYDKLYEKAPGFFEFLKHKNAYDALVNNTSNYNAALTKRHVGDIDPNTQINNALTRSRIAADQNKRVGETLRPMPYRGTYNDDALWIGDTFFRPNLKPVRPENIPDAISPNTKMPPRLQRKLREDYIINGAIEPAEGQPVQAATGGYVSPLSYLKR